MSTRAMFPLFLDLTDRKVVVVGAGTVAASKAAALLAAGARVVVVAPEIGAGVEALGVPTARRPFTAADLDDAWLVVAAAPRAVNREVAAAAASRRLFVNAVDDPRHASAYLGAVLRRAGVTVAIATDGAAPALSGLLREGLDALLPIDLEAWMHVAREERRRWKADGVPMADRRPRLVEALNRLYARDRAGREAGAAGGPA